MAFPGTYNFTYYKGDTFEFRISPRNADGTVFNLSNYQVAFTVSTARGTAGQANRRTSYAAISGSDILCAILPANSATWPASQSGQYVYDVEIRNLNATPYPKVYTLLTGTISVQDQVTDVTGSTTPEESGIDVIVINPPTNFDVTGITANSITIDWDAPAVGGDPYIAYVPGYVSVPPGIVLNPQTGLPSNIIAQTPISVGSGVTTYTFTGLLPLTTYIVGVTATDGTNFSNLSASLQVTTLSEEESGLSGESGLES